ncbi:related to interferon-regulated resistance GTP-binding protein [Cephalotrichum gorgonifer]|uniref:Related to interferon-regulated resistance GTP-binding protein n=1 Tax=Cephalotrichum gorgonifer TaxID=2041049 RepID=A0AAE8N6T7_9PEZI|nr:related to interferon-regulated resistance GTP-binding protein [Cephalotrichum gorgonifer]
MADSSKEAVLDSVVVDELNTESKALLDTIDSLRALNVGEIVNLPQIIVVGDQSSGKSSVLEAISHVKFPVKGDLCTRFATELALRKSSVSSVDVSIRFSDPDRSSHPFQKSGFHLEDLPQLIEEAKERMGIRVGGIKGFSKDVLRVEVTGPDVPSLTLVDLPGFFHSETADQSREGKETVDMLVESYMKQPNSIILAVVAANAQPSNQIVLEKCKTHDPGRTRTLGIVTKPDLALAGSADERKYLQLAQNKESVHKFALGWHVLRNRSESEGEDDSHSDRNLREANFLASGAWASLSPGNKGISSLRKKLSKVLLDHIQKTLPGLINDIKENIDERMTKLAQLGNARATPDHMKAYLIGIAEEFQKLVRDGVNGIYADKFFGDLDDRERKLRAKLRNLNQAFSIVLSSKGASQKIVHDADDEGDSEVEGDSSGSGDDSTEVDVPSYLEPFVSCFDEFPEPEVINQSDLNRDLEALASGNQGREFPGIPNKDLVVQLFQKQARPWKGIARFYVNLATDVVKGFIEELITHVVGPDEATAAALLRNVVDPFFDERREVVASKVEEMLYPYVHGYGGLPFATEYRSRMSRRAARRLADQVGSALAADLPVTLVVASSKKLTSKKIREALSRPEALESSEFGTEQIVDMMEVYYEMSCRTFSENVVNLAVESCLVRHVEGMLTPKKVNLMDDESLRDLAAESPDITFEREMLEAQVSKLKDGLKMCQRHKPRGTTALPSTISGTRSVSSSAVSGPPNATMPDRTASTSVGAPPNPLTNLPEKSQPKLFSFSHPVDTPSSADKKPSPHSGLFAGLSSAQKTTPASSGLFAGLSSARKTTSASSGLFAKSPSAEQSSPAPSGLFAKSPSAEKSSPAPSSLFAKSPSAEKSSPAPSSLFAKSVSAQENTHAPSSLFGGGASAQQSSTTPTGLFAGLSAKQTTSEPSGLFAKSPSAQQKSPAPSASSGKNQGTVR